MYWGTGGTQTPAAPTPVVSCVLLPWRPRSILALPPDSLPRGACGPVTAPERPWRAMEFQRPGGQPLHCRWDTPRPEVPVVGSCEMQVSAGGRNLLCHV